MKQLTGRSLRLAVRKWLLPIIKHWEIIYLLLAFVAIPFLFSSQSYILNVLITGAMLGFMSLGVWLTFEIGRVNIAQGGFALIGGYTSAILMTHLNLSFWICLPLSGLVAALTGSLIGLPILRLKGIYFSMITLSLTEAIRLVFLNASFITEGATGLVNLSLPGSLSLFRITLIPAFQPGDNLCFYYLAAVLLGLGLLFMTRLINSRIGGIFQALQQNEDLALSLGINIAKYRIISFTICCFYGGIGGAFFTAFQQNIYPTSYQVADSVYFMIYCFIGGLDYIFGPVIGAFTLVIAFEALSNFQRYQPIVYALVMIGCMMFLPNGVLSLIPKLAPSRPKLVSATLPLLKTDEVTHGSTLS